MSVYKLPPSDWIFGLFSGGGLMEAHFEEKMSRGGAYTLPFDIFEIENS